jgi:hypothetical protein
MNFSIRSFKDTISVFHTIKALVQPINLSFKSLLLMKRHAWRNKTKLVISPHISLTKKAMKIEFVGGWFYFLSSQLA